MNLIFWFTFSENEEQQARYL